MRTHVIALLAGLYCVKLMAAEVNEDQRQYAELCRELGERTHWDNSRLAREVLRPEALIQPEDRTPLDIVLRRTAALLQRLKAAHPRLDFTAEAAELAAMRAAPPPVAPSAHGAPDARFVQALALRRRIAFRNPLLDFDRIIFLKHDKIKRGDRHMVDQYFGFNQTPGGGVFVLENAFGKDPRVRNLLAGRPVENGRLKGKVLDNIGSFISLDLDFDGRTIAFAFTEAEASPPAPDASFDNQPWTRKDMEEDPFAKKTPPWHNHYYWTEKGAFHIFRANSDGTGLGQLTDGMWNEYDPCFLPNGRIAFVSEKNGGQSRCSIRPVPTASLHSMRADGSDRIRLSWHDTNEWHPSVDNNGMLVYTRWDYVDRDSDVAHHLWSCFPDGRDPRSAHGNYPATREARPWMEMSARAIPGSHRYVAVAAPHHGQAYGSLVLIDQRERDDRKCGQIDRLTPEVGFPEAESYPGVPVPRSKATMYPRQPEFVLKEVYGTPWPLSEDFYLCVYDPKHSNYGIYLIDSFGNRELLYRDPSIACLDPIPLRARPRPPAIPSATKQAAEDRGPSEPMPATGEVLIVNAYESDQPWPENTRIMALRIVNIFPKDNFEMNAPNIGVAWQSLARGVLGTVPVESDGSAYFKVPAGAGIYFQALDEKGLAVQTMRSATYVHPGERLNCLGCHEPKQSMRPPTDGFPLALQRAPSAIAPEPAGSYPLTFPRLVQPVLDAKCVSCHERSKGKAPPLRGDRFNNLWLSAGYISLIKGHATERSLAWAMCGGNGVMMMHDELQYSVPGRIGARVSGLYQLLKAGHHGVKLSDEELRRITLWLDCNSNFYGAYHDTERQARGEVVAPKLGIPAWTDFEKLKR